MAYIMLVLYIVSCTVSAIVGFRIGSANGLGRDGSAGGRGGRYNQSAGCDAESIKSTVESVESAVGAATEDNKQVQDVVGRMRDIVQRNRGNVAGIQTEVRE